MTKYRVEVMIDNADIDKVQNLLHSKLEGFIYGLRILSAEKDEDATKEIEKIKNYFPNNLHDDCEEDLYCSVCTLAYCIDCAIDNDPDICPDCYNYVLKQLKSDIDKIGYTLSDDAVKLLMKTIYPISELYEELDLKEIIHNTLPIGMVEFAGRY